jgi:protein-S-isoprenylcysteine O-methyltransferase Ste14
MLFLRALTSFLLLPGLIAYAVPALFVWDDIHTQAPSLAGIGILLMGSLLLLWCVRDFYVAGKGTLAPWDPPKNLVRVGLYRFTRNPMYVSVTTVLIGWALAYRSWSLAIYAVAMAVAFHVRVVLGEEPWLARTHGDSWSEYTARVRRWI